MKNQLLTIAILFTACLATSSLSAHEHGEKKSNRQLAAPIKKGSGYEVYKFSPAIRAGDFVYLSGVVANLPRGEDGKIVAANKENLVAAYEQAFGAIDAILKQADSSWDDVVEMTTYHTELTSQGAAFAVVKDRYVLAPYPAWTAIDIDALFSEGGVTEIKVVAYAPKK